VACRKRVILIWIRNDVQVLNESARKYRSGQRPERDDDLKVILCERCKMEVVCEKQKKVFYLTQFDRYHNRYGFDHKSGNRNNEC